MYRWKFPNTSNLMFSDVRFCNAVPGDTTEWVFTGLLGFYLRLHFLVASQSLPSLSPPHTVRRILSFRRSFASRAVSTINACSLDIVLRHPHFLVLKRLSFLSTCFRRYCCLCRRCRRRCCYHHFYCCYRVHSITSLNVVYRRRLLLSSNVSPSDQSVTYVMIEVIGDTARLAHLFCYSHRDKT